MSPVATVGDYQIFQEFGDTPPSFYVRHKGKRLAGTFPTIADAEKAIRQWTASKAMDVAHEAVDAEPARAKRGISGTSGPGRP